MDTHPHAPTVVDLPLLRVVDAIDDAHRAARELPYGDPLRTALADLQLAAHNERRRRSR